jgi:hypothetical protein
MTEKQALDQAQAMLGLDAYVQDRRRWRPASGHPLGGNVIIGVLGPTGMGHIRGFGRTWELALERAWRTVN